MPIETICKGCARKLRVGDEHAGKKARCPHCKTVYTVPSSPEPDRAGPLGSGLGSDPFMSSAEPERWFLVTEDGREFGPVPKPELDSWLTEGRITANCQVRRDGESHSLAAATLYPSLQPAGAFGGGTNPFADQSAAAAANPYASPTTAAAPATRMYSQAHRGGAVLTLGILALICNICFIPGICAWTMGNADIAAMNAGRMDPSGRSMTQVGMILGIVGTVLAILGVGLQLLVAVAGGM